MEKTSYRRIRWRWAWDGTWRALGDRMKLAIVSAIFAAVNACAISYFAGKPADMSVALYAGLISIATVCATAATTFLGYLLWYFTAAPSRLYEEDQKKIAELEEKLEQKIATLRTDFALAFHNYADARADLWHILDSASARQREVKIDSGSVRESMREVEFPENILKIRQNDSLYEYATGVREWWGGKKKEFLEFCLALYQEEEDSAILDFVDLQRLESYRRDLAKFWDDWERRCKSQGMSIGDLVGPDLIQSQTPDVVMLTYLEIARGLQKKENSRGKQGLFTIAKEFREFSNS